MKRLTTLLVLSSLSLLATNPKVPMPPSFGGLAKPYPESCKPLPRMIVFLPPPMEADFRKCKNDLYMPTVADASLVLLKKFGKGVSDIKISLADGFYQLYQVDFKLNGKEKRIFVNGNLTKFIDGNIENLRK